MMSYLTLLRTIARERKFFFGGRECVCVCGGGGAGTIRKAQRTMIKITNSPIYTTTRQETTLWSDIITTIGRCNFFRTTEASDMVDRIRLLNSVKWEQRQIYKSGRTGV